jgi:hypothetical protein
MVAPPSAKAELFTEKFWNRPSPGGKGDGNPDSIAQAVGYALTNWERADQEMAGIFIVMTGTDVASTGDAELITAATIANAAIRRAFGAIHTSTGRRDAITSAAEIHFGALWDNKEVKKSWMNLYTAIGRASILRDDLAHGIIWGKISLNGIVYGAFLMPPEYNSDRTHAFIKDEDDPLGFMRAKYRYTKANIETVSQKFATLREALNNYANVVTKRKGVIPLVEAILSEQRR